jgi:hypothetical protein
MSTVQLESERRRTRAFRAAVLAAVAAVVVVVVAVLLLTGGDDDSELEIGTPAEVSAQELGDFAEDKGQPVYWAGEIPGTKLELTETSRNYIFVRYLPDLAPIGDRKPSYTTVATYPQARALATARRAGRNRGNVSTRVPGGGIAVWSRARPTSVYVAFPGDGHLIEVFHPQGSTARDLARSGRLKPIS